MDALLLKASPRHTLRLIAFGLLLAVLAPPGNADAPAANKGQAATFSLDRNVQRVVSLDGLWRFHMGDNPQWADPGFDDSSWARVRSDTSWPEQGLPVASGSFWYRTRVLIPAGSKTLSVYIPPVHINYQIFADGVLIGGVGPMPPHPRAVDGVASFYPVPAVDGSGAHIVVIAVRVWRFPVWSSIDLYGLEPGILIGDSKLIQQTALLHTRERAWNFVSTIFLTLLEILAGLAALALFKVRIREREYLWFGVAMLLSAANGSISTYRAFRAMDVLHVNLLQAFFGYAIYFALIGFYRHLMDGRRGWFYRSVIATLSIAFLLNVVGFAPFVLSQSWLLTFWFPAVFILQVPFYAWILILLARKSSEGRADALLLLLSNAPGLLDLYVPFLLLVGGPFFGWKVGTMDWFYHTGRWPFPFSIDDLSTFLLLLTMLAVLIHRFTRTSLEEEDHKRELEAARIVQQVLIPDAIPTIPGFNLQSIYKPAGQVGGDFFQILPVGNGSVLVVIGDVSGKGMPAAMTVSLLVGTVRTLAHFIQNPGAILSAMNHRMMGRTSGGFTTCLVLRADPDGTLTVANAGHLPPYLNGSELRVENGLPLGLDAAATYSESSFQLAAKDQLTLLTDGVAEARSSTGELFGFERTQAIATQPAESIAETAQHFGQEDDITVVTLACLA